MKINNWHQNGWSPTCAVPGTSSSGDAYISRIKDLLRFCLARDFVFIFFLFALSTSPSSCCPFIERKIQHPSHEFSGSFDYYYFLFLPRTLTQKKEKKKKRNCVCVRAKFTFTENNNDETKQNFNNETNLWQTRSCSFNRIVHHPILSLPSV